MSVTFINNRRVKSVSEKLNASFNGNVSINPLLSEMLGATKKIKKLTVSVKYLINFVVTVKGYILVKCI